MTDEVTTEELEQLAKAIGYGSGSADTKQNVHTFLHNVATAKDTTKLGYLKDEEIGNPENPLRSFKYLSLFAEDIMNRPSLSKFFAQQSEIITSTSLSKGAILIKLAVTQKKELADVTKDRKENKSWFKKKDTPKDDE